MEVEILSENPNKLNNDATAKLYERLEALGLPEGCIIRIYVTKELDCGYYIISGRRLCDHTSIDSEHGVPFNIITNFRNVIDFRIEHVDKIVSYDGVDYMIGSNDYLEEPSKNKYRMCKKYYLKVLSNEGPENGNNVIREARAISYVGKGLFEVIRQDSAELVYYDVKTGEYIKPLDDYVLEEARLDKKTTELVLRRTQTGLQVAVPKGKYNFTIKEGTKPNEKGKVGLVTGSGFRMLPIEYDEIRELGDSEKRYYLAVKDGLKYIFDTQSRSSIELQGDIVGEGFRRGLLCCKGKNGYTYFDENMNPVFSFDFKVDDDYYYGNGYLCCKTQSGKYVIITKDAEEKEPRRVTKPAYCDVRMVGKRFFEFSNLGNDLDKARYFDTKRGSFVNLDYEILCEDGFLRFNPIDKESDLNIGTKKIDESGNTLKKELPKPGDLMV